LKKGSEAPAKHGDVLKNNKKNLIESLDNVLKNLEALNGRKEQVPTYEMR